MSASCSRAAAAGNAGSSVLAAPRSCPEAAHLGPEALEGRAGDLRRELLAELGVREAELAEPQRGHLVRDQSPLPCEAVRGWSCSGRVVAGLERDGLAGQLHLKRRVPGIPPPRIEAAPQGSDEAQGEQRESERDEADAP
jgi:hypothetical protein